MIIERARIKSNRPLAHEIWEMQFEAPNIAREYMGSGQFINILTVDDWNHPLRRPMSIASSEDGFVSIIYKNFEQIDYFKKHFEKNLKSIEDLISKNNILVRF